MGILRRRVAAALLGCALPFSSAVRAETPPVRVEVAGDRLRISHEGGALDVALASPRLSFDGLDPVGGAVPETVEGDLLSGERLSVVYPPAKIADTDTLGITVFLQWSAEESILWKWAELVLSGAAPRLLQEVVLETLPVEGREVSLEATPPQSYPAFMPGFFAGIEYPVASTRIDHGELLLAHQPSVLLAPGTPYVTRKAVYGAAPASRELEMFHQYIARRRPTPNGLHVNYNSWWTSSVPFAESEILGLMDTFEQQLYQAHGVPLDTFTIDMGWSDSKSLWGISADRFPQGFTAIQQATEKMSAHLGLWISPTCFYSPAAVDTEWAAAQGFETSTIPWVAGQQTRVCCLGGPRYAAAFRERLVDMITRFGIRHVKLDGYNLLCNETSHGHAPGPLSAEAVAAGGIAAFDAMHAAAPEVWLEATCFGWNPSPWWLFHVNSVIGTFGDDAPHGRVPAPVYRESYTTGRDFFNLQGAARLKTPIVAQEVLGIVHQTNDPFMNDAVDVILRGHAFLTMYVNPKYMNESRWTQLAGAIDWARRNPVLLEHTEPLLPASWLEHGAPAFTNDAPMPREPYGYAHWNASGGLIGLRNPWIRPASISVAVGGVDAAELSAVSLYPEPRVYAQELHRGDTLDVPLAPYETLVLSIAAAQSMDALPQAAELPKDALHVVASKHQMTRVTYEGDATGLGADWTALTTPGSVSPALDLDVTLEIGPDGAILLVLLEGDETPQWPALLEGKLDGNPLVFRSGSSDAGWFASTIPAGSERWQFIEADLPPGAHTLNLRLAGGSHCSRLSVWALATRPGSAVRPAYPNALPAPETVSLDAAPLLDTVDVNGIVETESRPVEIERIDGVFLDALDPVSATQGWGELQRNQTILENPLRIGGRNFVRGLGTHAPSRIVYDLRKEFRRFQAWAGASAESSATITFEVWVDGQKKWESRLMTPSDVPERVEVDVSGADRLELVVTDGGNGAISDHGNWADARLLRLPPS